MIEIKTKEELEKAVNGSSEDELVIIKFSAEWCQPCKQMGKIIEKLEPELNKVKFYEVNVDDADDLVEEYHIMGIPALLYFKSGLQVDKSVGANTEAQFKTRIEENLKR